MQPAISNLAAAFAGNPYNRPTLTVEPIMPNLTLADLTAEIEANVRRALTEDIGSGDITAQLIPAERLAHATVITRETAVIAGSAWVDAVFRRLDPRVAVHWQVRDGERVSPNQALFHLEGPARALLSGERSALNFLQTLSAVATRCQHYADLVQGTAVKLLDTRKTLPGLRLAQKYAVCVGGGVNHRMGLHDAVMLKENHVRAAGSLVAAIRAARALHPALPLIVEVETLAQLEQALHEGCERILIDDFVAEDRRAAVRIAHGAPFHGRIPLEVSGGVDLAGVRAIAEDGVDCISIGGLTKHVRAIDLSLKLGPPT